MFLFGWQENKLCLNSAALFYCFLLFTPPFGEWREGGGGGDGDFALFFFFLLHGLFSNFLFGNVCGI